MRVSAHGKVHLGPLVFRELDAVAQLGGGHPQGFLAGFGGLFGGFRLSEHEKVLKRKGRSVSVPQRQYFENAGFGRVVPGGQHGIK